MDGGGTRDRDGGWKRRIVKSEEEKWRRPQGDVRAGMARKKGGREGRRMAERKRRPITGG